MLVPPAAASATSFQVASCGEMRPSPLCMMRWPAKNASSYLSLGSCDFRRLLIHTVFGASNRDRTIERADLS